MHLSGVTYVPGLICYLSTRSVPSMAFKCVYAHDSDYVSVYDYDHDHDHVHVHGVAGGAGVGSAGAGGAGASGGAAGGSAFVAAAAARGGGFMLASVMRRIASIAPCRRSASFG